MGFLLLSQMTRKQMKGQSSGPRVLSLEVATLNVRLRTLGPETSSEEVLPAPSQGRGSRARPLSSGLRSPWACPTPFTQQFCSSDLPLPQWSAAGHAPKGILNPVSPSSNNYLPAPTLVPVFIHAKLRTSQQVFAPIIICLSLLFGPGPDPAIAIVRVARVE